MSDFLGDFAGPMGSERVAAFVDSVSGDAIEARTADLTPSGIGLVPMSPTPPTGTTSLRDPAPPSRTWIAWAAASAALALAFGFGLALLDRPEAPPPLASDGFEAPSMTLERFPPIAAADVIAGPSPRPTADKPRPASPTATGNDVPGAPGQAQPSTADRSKGTSVTQPAADVPAPRARIRNKGAKVASARSGAAAGPTGRPVRPALVAGAEEGGISADEPDPADGREPGVDEDAPKVADAVLTLDTVPWTQVSIDASARGATPLYRQAIKPGRHILHLVNPEEGIDVWRTIVVAPGEVLHLTWNLAAP